ncbi:ATP binding protein [Aureococcus anophagefferens]|nr:ATP binding protein [Aureococcus anophagefferens]
MGPSRSLGKLCESSSEDEGEDIEMFSPPSKKSFFDSSSDDDSECDEPPKKKTKPFSPAQPRVDADGADAPADAFACADPEALTAAESDAFLARALARGFGFPPLPHQLAAIRRAGVPAGWPRAIVGGDCNETMASAALTEDRHAVLGDEMGLGKTVETLAACQWQQHLAKLEAAVHLYGGADRDAALERTLARHADHADRGERALYVLLTRYTLMNAVRKGCDFSSPRNCALFPRATPLLLRKLHVLYLAKQKPEDFKKQLEDGTLGRQDPDIVWYHELQRKGTDDESAIIRDLVAEHLLPVEKPTFDIVCVDEAHMIRNDAAYWGLGAALLGHHARPRATSSRRKEIVLKGLPTKTQGTLDVPVVKALDATLSDVDAAIAALDATQSGEFKVCVLETQAVAYYREFCGVMLALSMGDRTPGLKAKANRLMKLMCCYFQMARSSLLHPVAPHGGRSITQTFVPKRKAYIHNKCVCCEENALEASTSIMSNLLNGVDVRRSRSPKTDGGDDDGGEEEFAGCDAVRYDGDVSAEQRFAELERFKTAPSVNVLLATVATAGVGLNIVEANNVLFLDRWWNPTVHDQAMDRTHRLGQTRPVDVRFLDGVDTVDEVMRAINKFKSDNAQVILASEPELPRLATKSVTWKDTSKLIGDEFARIFESRARKLGIEKLMQADVFDNVPDPPAPGDPKGPRDRRQVDVPRSMQADPIRVVPKKMETDDEDCELVVVVPSDEAAAARALAGSPSAPSVIDLISDDDDDDAAPPAAPTRGWRCPACTVVNENPAFLCCATCGTERPP